MRKCVNETCPLIYKTHQDGSLYCQAMFIEIIVFKIQWDLVTIPVCKTGLEAMGIEIETLKNRLDFSMRSYYGRQE